MYHVERISDESERMHRVADDDLEQEEQRINHEKGDDPGRA